LIQLPPGNRMQPHKSAGGGRVTQRDVVGW
jgi:hypothetical protein